MSLGIIMKGFNAIHFGNKIDFVFEFIPQLVLLLVLFGWMDVLIISKWLYEVNSDSLDDYNFYTRSNAPSIITIMINMFLGGGEIAEHSYPLINGQ